MPAIAKILIVFASVLALTRLRLPLGVALILGGVALNAWAGLTAADTAVNLGRSLAASELWLMLGITGLIVEIGRYMTEKRNADTIVGAAHEWGGRHGRSTTLMLMPAVIGLVPMPAGALFSAPFVGHAAGETRASDWKSAVNYWFRHVWEYWWPLYPGVIVAMAAFGMIPTWQFIAVQFPFTPLAILSGYLFLVHPHVRELAADEAPPRVETDRRVVRLLLPLAIIILSVILLPPLFKAAWPEVETKTRQLLVVLIGLVVALVFVVVDEWGHDRRRIFSTLLKRQSVEVQISLLGVLIFKGMLDRSGLLPTASHEVVSMGIPMAATVAALPFLAGLVTGIALGFTGASFPLVVGLMQEPGAGMPPLATLVLAYGFGYMGMMVSPVHLCLIVTRDYFSSSMRGIVRRLMPCYVTVLVFSLVSHALLRWLGW
jgi:integral membrane protein (TIGR00529 family)